MLWLTRAGGISILYKKSLIVAAFSVSFTLEILSSQDYHLPNANRAFWWVDISPGQPKRQKAMTHLCRIIKFLRQKSSNFSLLRSGKISTQTLWRPYILLSMHKVVIQCKIRAHSWDLAAHYAYVYIDYFLWKDAALRKSWLEGQ